MTRLALHLAGTAILTGYGIASPIACWRTASVVLLGITVVAYQIVAHINQRRGCGEAVDARSGSDVSLARETPQAPVAAREGAE
jgi:hypothetical protein